MHQLEHICVLFFLFQISTGQVSPKTYPGYQSNTPRVASILSNDIISTFEDCLRSCQRMKLRCAGATFSQLDKSCRLHMSWTIMCKSGMSRNKDYIFSQVIPCPSPRNNRLPIPQPVPTTDVPISDGRALIPADAKQVAAGCLNVGFLFLSNFHALGGTLRMSGTTVEQCKALCQADATCLSTDWNRSTGGCFFHTSVVQSLVNGCCVRCIKTCGDTALTAVPVITTTTTAAPTTTTTTPVPTTQGPNIIDATIPDDGKCPSPLLLIPNMSILGGVQVTTLAANTPEACKQFCINTATCVAVDFNVGLSQCFQHTVLGALIANTGVNHFRKTNCEKQCYQHAAMTVSAASAAQIPLFQNIALTSLPTGLTVGTTLTTVSCTGTCFYRHDVIVDLVAGTVNNIFERGCDAAAMTEQCPVTSAPPSIFQRCSCARDRCNGAGMDAAINNPDICLAYYSFDCTLDDGSIYMRHGMNQNGVMFDPIVAQKNFSAMFNGTNYIQVRPFQNIRLGQSNQGANQFVQYTPDLTVALWVYTTGTGDMTIYSNGIRNLATLELKTLVSGMTQTFTGTVRLGTQGVSTFSTANTMSFSVTSSSVPVMQWVYVVLRLDSAAAVPVFQIFAANTPESFTPDNSVALVAFSATPVVGISGELCIGKQYTVVIPGNPILQPSFNFVGKLDEMYMFNVAYSLRALAAIRDASAPFA